MSPYKPQILFEDNHLLVVVKPVGIATQGEGRGQEDLLSLLKVFIKQRDVKPGNVFLGLVHRLDQPVGGVMVFAKTSKAASRLSQQIREHAMRKTYLAVVEGILLPRTGALHHFLHKDHVRNRVSVRNIGGGTAQEAELHYEALEQAHNRTLVRIELVTGRSHQIRAQFSAIHHPLVGDVKYGAKEPGALALWAFALRFEHPTTHEIMEFTSEPIRSGVWGDFRFPRL